MSYQPGQQPRQGMHGQPVQVIAAIPPVPAPVVYPAHQPPAPDSQQGQKMPYRPGQQPSQGICGQPVQGVPTEKASSASGVAEVPAYVRSAFVQKVYAILTAQMLLTAAIAALCVLYLSPQWIQQHAAIFWSCYFVSLGVIFGVGCCCPGTLRVYPRNYIVLFVLTVCWGVVIGFLSAFYTAPSVGLAAGITSLIFGGLTAYACTTKSDFTGKGPYLFGALWAMLVFGLVLLFVPGFPVVHKIFAGLGALLFSLSIIFDTQLIVGGKHKKHEFGVDDYVLAALTLYLDIINLFLFILNLSDAILSCCGKRS